jgi:hypothetical protein
MIELAWLWLRHQLNSPLSIWFRERVGTGKARIRRIAIVAVARKLSIGCGAARCRLARPMPSLPAGSWILPTPMRGLRTSKSKIRRALATRPDRSREVKMGWVRLATSDFGTNAVQTRVTSFPSHIGEDAGVCEQSPLPASPRSRPLRRCRCRIRRFRFGARAS